MLAAAFGLNLNHGRWWLALGGIASIIFGILLVIEPLIGAVVLTMWVGAYAIVFGVFLLVLGFQLHSRREEHKRKAPAAAAARKPDRARSAPDKGTPSPSPCERMGRPCPNRAPRPVR